MAKNIISKLKALKKQWKAAEPQRGGASIPDGTYECTIESCTLQEAKTSGRLQVLFTLVVSAGAYENKKIFKYDGLDNEKSLGFLMGTLETLNIAVPDDIEEIGESLEAANGLAVLVQVKTKDEFTNIYINELLDADDSEDAEEDEDSEEDSDEEEAEDEDEESDDEAEEEEEEEEEAAEVDADSINAMKLKELLAFVKAEELKIKGAKDMAAGPLRKAIIKALEL